MTAPTLLSLTALLLAAALVCWRVRRRQKREADKVFTWTEPRQWDTYGWQTRVDARPLEAKK